MMLWTEKYRPDSIAKLMGQEGFRMDAENWVELGDMPNLLLFGTAGVGKTAASLALAKDVLGELFDVNFLELNASDDRKLETVRTKIKEFASQGKIGEVPFRIILLDEVDGMTSDAQNALKRIMERYSSNIRFIITCNDRNKIIFALQSRCANYHFKPLTNEVILEVIQKILQAEGVERFSQDELVTFISSASLDLRRVITEVQAAKSSNTSLKKQIEIGLEDFSKGLDILINNKNSAIAYFHKMLVDGRSVKEICIGMHDAVINSEGLDAKIKFKFLRTIGETEWRSTTMTPKVLLSWMVGQP